MKPVNFKITKCTLLLLIIFFSFVLRFIWIDKFPPSPYSDEVDQAYNAYSILKTGRDEHGKFMPISFRSFGDWKPPVQTYLMVPAIAIFGLNTMALRTPSIILGALSVFLSYLIIRKLFSNNSKGSKIALLTAFIISISPWHLHQSRSAMLVIVALFFAQLGFYFFLKFLEKKYYLFLSVFAFTLSFYSYYGMRLVIPILCLFLLIRYKKYLFKYKKFLLVNLSFGLVLILPLFLAFLSEPDVVFGRAKTVSIFYDKGTKLKLWELQTQDGVKNIPSWLSRFYHNKPYLYTLNIIKRFFDHFDGQFLFIKGDLASPFLIPNMGVLYLFDGIFIVFGIYKIIKSKDRNADLMIVWLVISIFPAALTFLTPTQNRTFNAVFAFSSLIAFGIISIITIIKDYSQKFVSITIISIVLVYSLSFKLYLDNYFKVLPLDYSKEWLYGFREVISYINSVSNNFSKVVFLPKTGMSYIFILFYNQYPPVKYQIEAKHLYKEDEVGFEHVNSFDKYLFLREVRNWDVILHQMKKGEIYIGRKEEIPDEFVKKTILYPNGEVAFKITFIE